MKKYFISIKKIGNIMKIVYFKIQIKLNYSFMNRQINLLKIKKKMYKKF